MNPDYDKMVREFLTPTVALFLFIFFIGAVAIGLQIWEDLMDAKEENKDLKRRLGRE
jgi:hypothetical protein